MIQQYPATQNSIHGVAGYAEYGLYRPGFEILNTILYNKKKENYFLQYYKVR